MARKIYQVYYLPTAESWYYLDKKLAKKTVRALIDHTKEHYGSMYNVHDIEIVEHPIDTKVVFK